MRPPGFAHPVYEAPSTSPDDQPPPSYATRAKLIAPTPSDPNLWTPVNERLRMYYTRQFLLVSNRGPKQDGYSYCLRCGLIEPSITSKGLTSNSHTKPYPGEAEQTCVGGLATNGLVLGTDFVTDVLLISLTVGDPISLRPGVLSTDVALRTLSEALSKAACKMLGIEATELSANYRPALTPAGHSGREAEIYLYDTLSGGAGFSRLAKELGFGLFEHALRILESCPDGCDSSCYRCLRSYKNKFEHHLLDRHIAAGLLQFLMGGDIPLLTPERSRLSTDLLFNDLERQNVPGLRVSRDAEIVVPGVDRVLAPILVTNRKGSEFVVDITGPLTPDYPVNEAVTELKEFTATRVLLVDELLIRKNLPRATSSLIEKLDGSARNE
jgi:hypothetical protein